MKPKGELRDFWDDFLHAEARRHFEEISSISYELIAGRTNYYPKHEEMYLKLVKRNMIWLMNDMIWFRNNK